jgi:hypothetical protein
MNSQFEKTRKKNLEERKKRWFSSSRARITKKENPKKR